MHPLSECPSHSQCLEIFLLLFPWRGIPFQLACISQPSSIPMILNLTLKVVPEFLYILVMITYFLYSFLNVQGLPLCLPAVRFYIQYGLLYWKDFQLSILFDLMWLSLPKFLFHSSSIFLFIEFLINILYWLP